MIINKFKYLALLFIPLLLATLSCSIGGTLTPTPTPIPTATPISPIVVIQQLRQISELGTISLTAQATVHVVQDNGKIIGISVPETEITYSASGDISAGFDLTEITAADVLINGDEVTINLPRPEILTYGLNKFDVIDIDTPNFGLGDIQPETIEKAENDAVANILAAACENEILEIANKNAEVAISNLLSTLSFNNINVVTQSNNTCP